MTVILVNAEAGRVPLPGGVVHCSVSSPPYFSLRAYEGDQARAWPEASYAPMPGLPPLTIPAMRCALGHEPTPEAFIGHLVACYREVWRVSRADSAHWLIVGDSYANDTKWGGKSGGKNYTSAAGKYQGQRKKRDTGLKQGDLMLIPHRLALALQGDGWTVRNDCVFAKVAPMPESVAGTRWERCRVKATGKCQDAKHFNQDDGHSGHISNRPGPQWQDCPGCPRCEATGGYVLRRGSWRNTRAHEMVLHLTKGMKYWSDGEAVREGLAQSSIDWINQPTFDQQTGGNKDYRFGVNTNRSMRKTLENFAENPSGRNPRSVLSYDDPMRDLFRFIPREAWNEFLRHWADEFNRDSENPVSVLTPRPESYSGKHYAVFSTNLIRPLIKSSCPVRCCSACGAGWAPQIERTNEVDPSAKGSRFDQGKTGINGDGRVQEGERYLTSATDYRPTCDCDATHDFDEETGVCKRCRVADFAAEFSPICRVPGIVLDPFFGSGTTGIVARELGVDCIGMDLSYNYLENQARVRLGFDAWDAWHQGRDGDVAGDLEGLPLFEGVE